MKQKSFYYHQDTTTTSTAVLWICGFYFIRQLYYLYKSFSITNQAIIFNSTLAFNALGGLFLLMVVIGIRLSWYADFTVSDAGIDVKIYKRNYVFIPSKDLLGIKHRNHYSVLFAKKITPFHMILGLLFGGQFFPAFVIDRSLPEYDEAIVTLEEMCDRNYPDQESASKENV